MRTLTRFRSALVTALVALIVVPLAAIVRGPDAGGYTATDATVYSFVDVSAGGAAVLAGTDDGVAALTLPFPFTFYGQSHSLVCVSSNGALYFIDAAPSCSGVNDIGNVDLALTTPNDWPALFPFWSDLTFQAPGAGAVFYQTVGAPGSRRFVIQWNNAMPIESANPVTFQIVLSETTNAVLYQYKTVSLGAGNPASAGADATVGMRNSGGAANNQQIEWSFNSPVLHDSSALLFTTALTPTITVANATFTYDGNPHAVTASAIGVNGEALTPVTVTYNGSTTAPTSAGVYTAIASFAANGTYAAASAAATLTINRATPSITWPTPAPISPGTALSSAQLNATASAPGTFVYAPPAGTVLDTGTQTLTTTFTPSDAVDYTSATASVALVVNAGTTTAPTVTFTGAPATAVFGSSFVVSATTNASTSAVVTATGPCSIAGTTITITDGVGACKLTATWPADSTYSAAIAHQTTHATRAVPTASFTGAPATAVVGSTFTVSATTNASTPVALSAAGACTIAGTTVTMTTGVGACHLKAMWAADSHYHAATRTQTTKAEKRTPVVTWAAPGAIAYGTALDASELNAMADVQGTFVYAPPAGRILAGGSHTLSVTFTPADAADYSTEKASVTLLVNPATPTITWNQPPDIVYGAALGAKELNARASVGGTYVYTPAASTVLTAGTHTLSVTFTPTNADDYTSVSASVTLNVGLATPKITWHSSPAIVYGAPLDATELDATANVAGTFVYTPAAGTIPGAGSQTVTVSFTPSDPNYTAASADVTQVVQRATPTITWSAPASITKGTPLGPAQLNATGSVPGTLVYSPAAGTVLGVGNHTLSVTLTPADGTDYATGKGTVVITVVK
jgi:hypothetical protein